jgi:hypothetical protein
MDYNKLLDEWAEQVYEKADKAREDSGYADTGSFKHGRLMGYDDGLIMALTMLTTLEKKYKKLEKE